MPVRGAPAAELAHGHQRGDGVPEDALLGGRRRPHAHGVRRRAAAGGLEHGLHCGLALADEPGDELRREEGLPEHLLDEGQPEEPTGALVVLLEDLG